MSSPRLATPPACIALADEGTPMVAPAQLVYSTSPLSALDTNGVPYVIKGDATTAEGVATIAAEAVGYALAREIGVTVPDFAIGTTPSGRMVFASRKLTDATRDCDPWLVSAGADGARTRQEVARIFVLDIWLANNDRNIGGLLGTWDSGSIRIVAIDFEKSQCVRSRHPRIEIPTLDPKRFWPQGSLGTKMVGTRVERAVLEACEAIQDKTIEAITECVERALPPFTWHADAASVLGHRRDGLREHVRQVWR